MEDPGRRLSQDAATNILTGLAHLSVTVQETFHTVLGESSNFAGLDCKGSRLDYCKQPAEVQLHMGQQLPNCLICYYTFQPSQHQLCQQLPSKLQELRCDTQEPGCNNARSPV